MRPRTGRITVLSLVRQALAACFARSARKTPTLLDPAKVRLQGVTCCCPPPTQTRGNFLADGSDCTTGGTEKLFHLILTYGRANAGDWADRVNLIRHIGTAAFGSPLVISWIRWCSAISRAVFPPSTGVVLRYQELASQILMLLQALRQIR